MMRTPQPSDHSGDGTDHDILVRLKENVVYFQDYFTGEIREVEKRQAEALAKIASEQCIQSKRIAEVEKDIIRKQSSCECNQRDIESINKAFGSYKETVEKEFIAFKEGVEKRVESIKEQHRRDLATAITLTSIIVGIITFLVGKFT